MRCVIDARDLLPRLLDRRTGGKSRDHLRHAVRASLHHHRAHVMFTDRHVHQRVDAAGKEWRRFEYADHLNRALADAHGLPHDRTDRRRNASSSTRGPAE
jgi:hypothetical protein